MQELAARRREGFPTFENDRSCWRAFAGESGEQEQGWESLFLLATLSSFEASEALRSQRRGVVNSNAFRETHLVLVDRKILHTEELLCVGPHLLHNKPSSRRQLRKFG